MVVAYEQLKQIPGKEAVAKWKEWDELVRGCRSGNLKHAETDDEMLARWERTTMLEVLFRLLLAHTGCWIINPYHEHVIFNNACN